MGETGGFPIDLILLGMVAAFLVLRLRSILGRRTGFEGTPQTGAAPARRAAPVIDGRAEPAVPAAENRPVPTTAGPLGQELARMQQVDRGFTPQRFLQGAEAAFRLVVAAFAAGERDRLRPLLTDETMTGFDDAITLREQAGETQRSEVKAIREATIEEATLRGTMAEIAVRFVSSQVSVTLDRNAQPVAGVDGITELTELWRFERDLASKDPAWRLAATQGA